MTSVAACVGTGAAVKADVLALTSWGAEVFSLSSLATMLKVNSVLLARGDTLKSMAVPLLALVVYVLLVALSVTTNVTC